MKKVFILLVLLGFFFLSGNAYASQKVEPADECYKIENLSSNTIYTPTCLIVKHYCGVQYQWFAGQGADDMSITNSPEYHDLIGGTYYHENSLVNYYNPSFCPSWYSSCAASYYSNLDEYSDFVYTTDFNNGKYGQSIYATKKYFSNPGISTIPCTIDQKNFIWKHDGSSSSVIYGTVVYNNEMVDITLDIPFLGYKSTTFSVGNQSFVLRTGPNKVSIRANSNASIPINDFGFAFIAC